MFKKKKTYFFIFLIIAIAGGAYYYKNKKPVVTYTTQKVEKGNLVRTVSVTGEIKAPVEADLSFKISGQVESISVNVGDRVEIGQQVATIDKGIMLSQLAQAQYDVAIQKQNLIDMDRKEDVYSHFQKEAQMDQIAKAEEAIKQMKTNINEAILFSPIAGTVIKRNVEVGEMTVANAVTENTSVLTIASDGDLQTQVNVPESDILNVKLGQKAKVSLDAFPSLDEKLNAEVSEIEPSSTVIQDVVYYRVKLEFTKSDARLKIGMSTNVDINTDEHNNVVMVPTRAVKNNNGQIYVEILNADGQTTKKANIQTGMKGDDGMIEVTAGLGGGENVVVLTSAQ
ncbi:MAG: efflux RND transporter periplasmic adaptor subunit [Parcubacteria group bacterium]